MKIGYARVSRLDQNLELQTDALQKAGVEKIYTDKASGATAKRNGLDAMLMDLRDGDCVVIWRLDRLARSTQHLIELSAAFDAKGVQLVSITENIDTTTPAGKLVFHIFGALAEFERNLIQERTYAGLEAARARGKRGGRKPVLTPAKMKAIDMQIEAAAKEHADPDPREIGRSVGASERTIRRYIAGSYSGC